MKRVGITFVCTICGHGIHSRFLPDTKPKCPSCGGETIASTDNTEKSVRSFCSSCHYEGEAYNTQDCPRCMRRWNGFPGHRPHDYLVLPSKFRSPAKQGPTGGVSPKPFRGL